jgi:hypothetical protein
VHAEVDRVRLPRDPPGVPPDREHAALARRLLAAAFACALAGCLPAGNPPAGRHLVKDRTLSGVFLSPSERDGVPSYVLATGPLRNLGLDAPYSREIVADVYAFADTTSPHPLDGLANVEPVIPDMDIPGMDPTRHTFATDSRGRLLYVRWNPAPAVIAEIFELWRFNPGSGAGEFLAYANPPQGALVNADLRLGVRPFLLSPGQTQVFVSDSGHGYVVGLDQRQYLWQANSAAFIGEDFYCSGIVSAGPNTDTSGSNIIRIKPDSDPEVLMSSTGQLGLVPIVGDFTPQLVLTLYTDQGGAPFARLDTVTLESTPFPAEKGQADFVSASPDGHFLLFRTAITGGDPSLPTDHRFFIYEWMADAFVVVDSSQTGKVLSGASEWRPGTSDVWFSTLPDGFAIWQPTLGVTTVSSTFCQYPVSLGQASFFTRDGRHWFSQSRTLRPTIYVGSADDPRAPLLPLNPSGTETDRHWETDDGRLLVEAWTSDPARNDIYLVDADQGTSRAIASAGHLVAVGQSRALALLDWQVSRSSGELTLIDYTSGARTVLAEDVYAVDVDRGKLAAVPPGTDSLAPGTRVAFLSRNRLEGRDDGLWVAELP